MTDVLIVGGGPVGLFLAALLLQEGVRVRVLEQRLQRDRHSRAIGIHPPALTALDRVGVASTLVSEGIAIRRGIAVSGGKTVGSLSFAEVSERFPFVLALPQFRTEEILELRVRELDPAALVRGARVTGIKDDGGKVTVEADAAYLPCQHSAALVVAADGSRSLMRSLVGIPVRSKTYPDHYVMGDYAAAGSFGQDAVLFLEEGGIVESFPLPGGLRRWVVRVGEPMAALSATGLAALVRRRTGVLPEAATNSMLSSFSVRSSIAGRLVTGRIALIGDAAHEISPIGGQGMNLGWLDAEELAPIICAALEGTHVGRRLQDFELRRRRAADVARWQSEVNMMLGRPLPGAVLGLRNSAIGAVAAIPAVNRLVARRFTMQ
ncbi:FAD-dependent monooxygenase [Arthrobacter sp. ISL-48]|uniref:FAD-dependent oxidoreductase n=1 Tax=Arthrobacter sp. ISL-48 TaxID=2819110 RepID=UPI001BE8ED32|nr:NAD(P)/FAD-dependent oxidoreductase [Arthrobacter sp. ISL-48]MBT2531338.1 FAD-dependent monooxygenase [Arthrobacter sp. ISL-48]